MTSGAGAVTLPAVVAAAAVAAVPVVAPGSGVDEPVAVVVQGGGVGISGVTPHRPGPLADRLRYAGKGVQRGHPTNGSVP
jgi:hypothetical protein